MDNINSLTIPLIFRRIMNDSFTGELFLQDLDHTKNLFFYKGNLVYSRSDSLSEQLGEMLFVLGKINKDQYDHISGLAHSGDNIVGEILVQSNFITEEDLTFARIHQYRKIAVNSFIMKITDYKIIKDEKSLYSKKLSIPLSSIIIEGVRAMKDLSLFINKIQYSTPNLFDIPDPIKNILADRQFQLCNNIKKHNGLSNHEIINALSFDPMEYWREMLIFVILEIIEFKKKEKSKTEQNEEIKDLLYLWKKLSKEDLDLYKFFNIDRNSDLNDINSYFKKILKRYSMNKYISNTDPKIREIAEAVFSKLIQVKKEMIIQIENEKKKVEEYNKFDIVLEDEVNNNVEFINLTEEDIIKPVELTEKDLIIDTFELTDADRIEPDEQKVENKVKLIDLKEEDNIKPEIEKNKKTLIPEQKHDDQLQLAQEQYDMGLYKNVIDMLKIASKNTDMKGEIYYLLGLSQSHFKESFLESEMNLKKAIELTPWSSGPIYALGNLYKKQHKNRLAQKCFERVMSMTANHGEAVKAVQRLVKNKK